MKMYHEPVMKRTLQIPCGAADESGQHSILGISVECGINSSTASSHGGAAHVHWHATCGNEHVDAADDQADDEFIIEDDDDDDDHGRIPLTGGPGFDACHQRVMLELTLDVRHDNVSLRSFKHVGVPGTRDQQSSSPHLHSPRYRSNSLHEQMKYETAADVRMKEGQVLLKGGKSTFDLKNNEPACERLKDGGGRDERSEMGDDERAQDVVAVLSKSMSKTEQALEGLRFISRTTEGREPEALWREVESRFHRLADPSTSMLSRSDFAACIGMRESKEFAVELLDGLTRRRLGVDKVKWISKDDLSKYWAQISDRSFHSRTQIFFDLCDKDSDGRIAEKEVKEVILLSASANKLSMMREQAEEYAALIMEELDRDNKGYIELSQLEALFREGFELNDSRSQTLSMQAPSPSQYNCGGLLRKVVGTLNFHVQNQWQRLWVVSLWLVTMFALFTWKFIQYKNRSSFQVMGYCVCTAKGAAETLKLNMALVLLPVCRNIITWFRSTFLGNVFPFDDSLNLHKEL